MYDGRKGQSRSQPDAMAMKRFYDVMVKKAMTMSHDTAAKSSGIFGEVGQVQKNYQTITISNKFGSVLAIKR